MNGRNDGPPINPYCTFAFAISVALLFNAIITGWSVLFDISLCMVIISLIVAKIVYNKDKEKWEAARYAEYKAHAKKRREENEAFERKWFGKTVHEMALEKKREEQSAISKAREEAKAKTNGLTPDSTTVDEASIMPPKPEFGTAGVVTVIIGVLLFAFPFILCMYYSFLYIGGESVILMILGAVLIFIPLYSYSEEKDFYEQQVALLREALLRKEKKGLNKMKTGEEGEIKA